MIGRSYPEYILIRTCILGFRLIAPLSIAYVAASWYSGKWILHAYLGYYASLEAIFYVCVYLPRSWLLQEETTHPPMMSKADRAALFNRCFSSAISASHAAGWFFSPSSGELQRGNVAEWILWALFSSTREDQLAEWQEEIDGYVDVLEGLLGHKLQEGYNDSIKCMKITMDPVHGIHRPFIWYIIVAGVDLYTTLYLHFNGFRHFSHSRWYSYFPLRPLSGFVEPSPHPHLAYWYRPHRSETKQPIVFFHGIGIGLFPYVQFFLDVIKSDPDVGILAFEDLSISMRISPPPLRRTELLEALPVVLDYHGFDKFVLIGHSFGTIVQAHILRCPELAQRVTSWLFIDPIPFLLHQPAVAYNFVYRPPKTANEWQLWYFASRDPDIARALARYFFWADNILFKDDLDGRRVGVVISGCDQIVDAEELRRYLTDGDEPTFRWESKDGLLQVLWYPSLDHAQVFDTSERRSPMVNVLSNFVREAGQPISNNILN